ncbi:Membrane protein involved in the export of O-antigen and teichoic acid [Sphingomonas gellani]|uniref:Membrane protein involved in the export of O-antigen and teichoic acid n=1 Tax=Sphingomonas gellani TaxID=1166340 RepID=A0A1H8DAU8_9SPHN|nr:lipopolysaccharide biosynthesis protein [Sphingomonas gellani]SEN03617.1 Membrane protein involved in the export of O-antigen and teichoic acid [Sphingomonas gellani]
MKHWFADGVFRTIVRNASFLGSGKLVGALLGLVALACAGRGMSAALFGTLVLIHSYANGVGGLVKFQTWQFIVRYGAPALGRDDRDAFRDVTGFAVALDLASGCVGLIGGLALLPLLAGWFGIGRADLPWALVYCTLIPTMTAATPTGILRVLDRFDQIAVQQAVTPLIRAVGGVISFAGHLGFPGFVVTWYVADLAGDLCLWLMAVRELRRRDMPGALVPRFAGPGRRLGGAWNFVVTTNIAHSVWSAWGPVSNLIVGAMLGPASAGLFKIAATFFDSASKPADLLSRSFYPEIMRLDPASRHPWLLAVRSGLIAGAMGFLILLLVVIGGEPLIGLVFGKRYLEAYDLLRLMTVSLVVSMASFPFESLLYMAGRQRAALVAEALAALGYAGLLFAMIHLFGLLGAGMAYIAGVLLKAVAMLIPTLAAYRKREAIPWSAQQAVA